MAKALEPQGLEKYVAKLGYISIIRLI